MTTPVKCPECSFQIGEIKAGKFHFESYAAAGTVDALCACGHLLTVVTPMRPVGGGRTRAKSTCTSTSKRASRASATPKIDLHFGAATDVDRAS